MEERDYIQIGEKSYRVANCWYATELFCELKGIEDLTVLDDLSNRKPSEIKTVIFCCLAAGAKLNNEKFDLNEDQISLLMNNVLVGKFLKIYARQSYDGMTPEELKEAKKVAERASKKK